MTNGVTDQQAEELRLLARYYCDGELTKSEYRRRRRQLLDQVDSLMAAETVSGAANSPKGPSSAAGIPASESANSLHRAWPLNNWISYLMTMVSVAVLGVIVALLSQSF